MELAGTIAENTPHTILAMKYILAQILRPDPSKRDLASCDEMIADCLRSEDYKEAGATLLKMSKPTFVGK